jgi:predicted lipoprotein
VTSSLRKIAWRCFFTIGKLKRASSAISWLLRPSQTSRATHRKTESMLGRVRLQLSDLVAKHVSLRGSPRKTKMESSDLKSSVFRACDFVSDVLRAHLSR